jgi:arabinofuranosyltransferase
MNKNQLIFYFVTAFAVVLAARYGLCIQDDTFISFRYAENLVSGDGLVFNPGERVEGITNLLWTLIFALFIAMGLDPVLSAYVLGMMSLGLVFWSTVRLSKELDIKWEWVALLILATDAALLLEAVEGLESVAYSAFATLAVSQAIKETRLGKDLWVTGVLCGIATLLRPEGPFIYVLIALGVLLQSEHPKRKINAILCGLLPVLLVLIGLTAFRVFYYGELVPNTFVAKVGGLQLSRGFSYWAHHALRHPVIWCGLFVAAFLSVKEKRYRLPVVFALGYTAYVLMIGGDFKPTSRFLLPIVPIMAILFADFCFRKIQKIPLLAISVFLCFIIPRGQLYQDSLTWAKTRRMNLLGRKAAGEWISYHTPPETVIAMRSVGVVPFYSKRVCIDMWGLNDKVIARTPISYDPNVLIGHERSNPDYVFSRNPDIYIPEDDWLVLDDFKHEVEAGFPSEFALEYTSISIPLGASYMNIWVRNSFGRDKLGLNIGSEP